MVNYIDRATAILEQKLLTSSDDNWKQNIKEYFDRIDAPCDLACIDRIVSEMDQIIDVLEPIGADIGDCTLNNWRKINEAIHDSLPEFGKLNISLHKNEKDIYGKKTSNPLYSMLWHETGDLRYALQYTCLKSAMFRVWRLLMEKKTNTDILYDRSLDVRIMGEAKNKNTLRLLPRQAMTLAEYVEELKLILDDEDIYDGKIQLSQIYRAIRIAIGNKDYPKRNNTSGKGGEGGGKSRGVAPEQQAMYLVNTIEDDIDPDYHGYHQYRLSEFERKDLRSSDMDVTTDDYNSQTSVYELIPRWDDYRDLDPVMQAIRLAGMDKALAMQNQHLPTHRSMMTLFESGSLVEFLVRELPLRIKSEIELEELTLLMLTFVYGRSLDDYMEMLIYTKEVEALPKNCRIAYILNTQSILIRVESPEYKTTLSEEQAEQAIPVKKYMMLGCPELLCDAIEAINQSVKKSQRSGYKCFPMPVSSYESNFRKIIRSVSGSSYTEVSVRKLVFEKLVGDKGDLADAIIITGQRYGIPESRLHYTTRPQALIAHLHKKRINDFMREVVHEFYLTEEDYSQLKIRPLSVQQRGYVGARLTWKTRKLQQAILGFRNNLQTLRKHANWYVFHNVFTAYVILMLDFSTGSRSVARKYFFESNFDVRNKRVTNSDKEGGDSHNTRKTGLPQLCIDQLDIYYNHLDTVKERLALVSVQDYHKVSALINQTPSSWRSESLRAHVLNNLGCFFFVNDKCEPIPYKPLHLRKYVKDFFKLPLNSNRHYLRFIFSLQRFSGEQIDAYLGHWSHGEHPEGRHSTLATEERLSGMTKYIENKLASNYWRLERGL